MSVPKPDFVLIHHGTTDSGRVPSWDVRVLHISSLLFTLGMFAVGFVLSITVGPIVLWLRDLRRRR